MGSFEACARSGEAERLACEDPEIRWSLPLVNLARQLSPGPESRTVTRTPPAASKGEGSRGRGARFTLIRHLRPGHPTSAPFPLTYTIAASSRKGGPRFDPKPAERCHPVPAVLPEGMPSWHLWHARLCSRSFRGTTLPVSAHDRASARLHGRRRIGFASAPAGGAELIRSHVCGRDSCWWSRFVLVVRTGPQVPGGAARGVPGVVPVVPRVVPVQTASLVGGRLARSSFDPDQSRGLATRFSDPQNPQNRLRGVPPKRAHCPGLCGRRARSTAPPAFLRP
jgi:hypothetical protein